MKLGVFGGTFDPVHAGHVVVATETRAQLGLDRVLLVVAGDPWQKRGRVVASAADDGPSEDRPAPARARAEASSSAPASSPAAGSPPDAPGPSPAPGYTAPAETAVPAPKVDVGSSNGSPGGNGAGTESAELPIPGYDALSASQVVQRLVGLSADELAAVHAYEATHRQRRTILGKIEQLAG